MVAKRDYYLREKLQRIDLAKRSLNSTKSATKEYQLSKDLFDMYIDLQIDSALYYAENMRELTEGPLAEDIDKRIESTLYTAKSYTLLGMYKECEVLLEQKFEPNSAIPDHLKELYYTTHLDLYKSLNVQVNSNQQQQQYKVHIQSNLDSLTRYASKGSIWSSIHLSNQLKASGKLDEALEILKPVCDRMNSSDRELANVAFYMADLYRLKGDLESEMLHLSISAITDIEHSVKSYVSLWKLAILLHEQGDTETAYKFIEISLEDAIYCGAFRWFQAITQVLPKIYDSYNERLINQRNVILLGFFLCSSLLVGIGLQYRKIRKTKNQLSKSLIDLKSINKELNQVSQSLNYSNAKLHLANSQLVFLNNELVSTGIIKETYLSKFIDLCSDNIDKLDDYRNKLRRLLKIGKYEKLQKELNSKSYIDSEQKDFLQNFDETFLKLFPDFVEEFNNLFPHTEQQILKKNELLNTELRIYALIRLGICDSHKIARFLRCSISTIYTYRSKIKNKSFEPETFEDTIRDYRKNQAFQLLED